MERVPRASASSSFSVYDGGSFDEGEVLALPVHQEGVDLIAGQGLFGACPLD